ncbi:DinI-like family protein [Escherichia coli]|uniref:DinI-like family protein n=1 Tax=Escherichia coli TaxID=562 RepID=UPI003CC9173D
MRIEVTIAKTSPLPAGAIDALAGELSRRIQYAFLIMKATYRYVMPQRIIYRLLAQQKKINSALAKFSRKTWESADDWFVSE